MQAGERWKREGVWQCAPTPSSSPPAEKKSSSHSLPLSGGTFCEAAGTLGTRGRSVSLTKASYDEACPHHGCQAHGKGPCLSLAFGRAPHKPHGKLAEFPASFRKQHHRVE